MSKKIKTTQKDFTAFKASFRHWAEKFGMRDYSVWFNRKALDERWAEIVIDTNGRIATVTMTSEYDDDVNDCWNPEQSGKHEAIHLFMERLSYVAGCRYIRPDDIRDAEEGMVRVLEKLL